MNKSKLEKFKFHNFEEKYSEKLMRFLGIKSKQEKEFKEKFPETPYFLNNLVEEWVKSYLESKKKGKYFMYGLGKATENEKEYIEYSLTEIGRKFRSIYIDFANNGDSKSLCWEFSVRLRDAYNHFFKQINLNQQAFLIHGRFNSSPHHWVTIHDNTSDISEIESLNNNTIYEGTIDQFASANDLSNTDKSRISGLKFATIGCNSNLRSLYKWEAIYPAPTKYFQEKQ